MKTQLTYVEFKDALVNAVNELVGEENVTVRLVWKPGDLLLDGICIKQDEGGLTPTVYINDLYDDYKGESIDVVANKVVNIRGNLKNRNTRELVQKFEDFESVKDKITFRVLNYSKNMRYLHDAIYFRRLDLVLVPQIMLELDEDSVGSVIIRQNLLKLWGLTEEALYLQAMSNVQKEKYVLRSLTDVLSDMLSIDVGDGDDEEEGTRLVRRPDELYVLSNESSVHGATVAFYPRVLKECSMAICEGGDLLIIPSSIHEVLLLDYEAAKDLNHVRSIVSDVNMTQVGKHEVLSNNIYRYDSENDRILIV